MNRFFVHLVWLVSAFSLTVSNAGVICFGHDGHVAIESEFHSHCDECCHADDTEADLQISSADCSPCTDVALETAPAESVKFQKTSAAGVGLRTHIGAKNLSTHNEPDRSGLIGASQYFSPLRDIILLT